MKVPLTPIRFLYRARAQFGSKTGVIDGEDSWTYSQFADRCHRLAALLLAWGIPPGARVAFLSYNSHALLEAYYGVLLAEAVLLPLNVRLTANDFRLILEDAEADVLFLDPDFLPLIEKIRGDLRTVKRFVLLEPGHSKDWTEPHAYDELIQQQSPMPDKDVQPIDEDGLAELFYTSGTSGRPKGVMLTHRNLYLHALEVALMLGTRDDEVQLHTIPLFHVNGWGSPQFLTCVGGCHVLMRKFEPQTTFQLIQKHRVTLFCAVPTMALSLLSHSEKAAYDLSSMRLVNLGGAPSTPELVRRLEETFSCQCVAGYGLTETSPVVTLAFPKAHLGEKGEKLLQTKAMTGYPVPGVELRILDQAEQPLPWDGTTSGELVVRGDSVMKGYWKEEQDDLAAPNGWFLTGDLATINQHGYVRIVDRKKDVIVSGGENISSLELEKALLSHPAVLECAVIAVPNSRWGEVPKAVVVLREGQTTSEKELLAHCRQQLARFKVPRSIQLVDSLPKGGTGKVLKRRLRESYWDS